MPASREHASLLAVDRAVSELRRGCAVAIKGAEGMALVMLAAEAARPENLVRLKAMTGARPALAITGRRAAVLGVLDTGGPVVALTSPAGFTAVQIQELSDPLFRPGALSPKPAARAAAIYGCNSAAIGLTKLARLLPAAVTADLANNKEAEDLSAWTDRHDLLLVDAGDVFQYEHTAARGLRPVSEAVVPLEGAEHTRIVAFRPVDGGLEHLAILIGDFDPAQPVLARLHSECFTGDLLSSLRCDCGDQLRGAIQEISRLGGGILLYLAQEGRGIGLVNKLRAYELQDQGHDTLDANEQLGFDADERVYLPAARMLELLGIKVIRLLTNNPEKVEALERYGVRVAERVCHTFPSNKHNEAYLRTKAVKGGHLF